MSYIAAAAIMGGAGIGGALLGRSSGGGGGWTMPPMTAEQKALMDFQLRSLMKAAKVKYPLREISGITPTEQYAEDLMGDYVTSPTSPALLYSLGSLMEQASTPVDLTKIPEYQGLLKTIGEEGDLTANRLVRGLQLGGNAQSGSGRDIIGRSITDTELKKLGALAPYGEAERARQYMAKAQGIPTLVEEIEAQILRKLAAPESYGTRDILQSILDAAYSQQYEQATLPLSVARLATGAQQFGPSYAYQPGYSASNTGLSQGLGFASMLMPFLFSGGGGGNVSNPIDTFAANPSAGNAALINDAWLSPGWNGGW